MQESNSKLHVLFLPLITPSHMIPLVNAARLFAGNGVKVTIITTKHNTALVQTSIDRDTDLGHDISFHNLVFPAAEVGLPEGVENFSATTSGEMLEKMYQALQLLREPMQEAIQKMSPHCIFSDMFFPWTVDLARKMNIPRIMFYVNSFVTHCVIENLIKYEPHQTVHSESESFLVPGLPHEIRMKRSQLEGRFKIDTHFHRLEMEIKESQRKSFALVFDNVYELEPEYADYYEKIIGTKIWTIGPLFHHVSSQLGQQSKSDCPDRLDSQSSQSRQMSASESWLDWLESQELQSVLFISFGSLVQFSDDQMKEIANGLEGSNRPFIWVVRNSNVPEGFEERTKKSKMGFIIKGWAPQIAILQHRATGGFMTHCGWNSVFEAIAAGVPLITWPIFTEQFYNEIAVKILKVGISLGSDVWNSRPDIEGVLSRSVDIEKAITRLLCDSEESREIRSRAKEIAQIVNDAVKVGGSSHQNLLELIHVLHQQIST